MTIEQHLQELLGSFVLQIASLRAEKDALLEIINKTKAEEKKEQQ